MRISLGCVAGVVAVLSLASGSEDVASSAQLRPPLSCTAEILPGKTALLKKYKYKPTDDDVFEVTLLHDANLEETSEITILNRELLGAGTYGQAFLGEVQSSDELNGREFAVKVSFRRVDRPSLIDEFTIQTQMMKLGYGIPVFWFGSKSCSVVNSTDDEKNALLLDDEGNATAEFYIMELMSGTMNSIISDEHSVLESWPPTPGIIEEYGPFWLSYYKNHLLVLGYMMSVLDSIHRHNVVHLDTHGSNLFILHDNDDMSQVNVKLGDFGLSGLNIHPSVVPLSEEMTTGATPPDEPRKCLSNENELVHYHWIEHFGSGLCKRVYIDSLYDYMLMFSSAFAKKVYYPVNFQDKAIKTFINFAYFLSGRPLPYGDELDEAVLALLKEGFNSNGVLHLKSPAEEVENIELARSKHHTPADTRKIRDGQLTDESKSSYFLMPEDAETFVCRPRDKQISHCEAHPIMSQLPKPELSKSDQLFELFVAELTKTAHTREI